MLRAREEVPRDPMPVAPPVRQQKLRIAVVSLAIVILGLAGSGLYLLNHRAPVAGSDIHSIAVLPLENLSGNPEQEYLADGMTDELITHLAKLGSPKVISRTSVMQYKRVRHPLSRDRTCTQGGRGRGGFDCTFRQQGASNCAINSSF